MNLNFNKLVQFTRNDSNALLAKLLRWEQMTMERSETMWTIYGEKNHTKLYETFAPRLIEELVGYDCIVDYGNSLENFQALDLMAPARSFLSNLDEVTCLTRGDALTLAKTDYNQTRPDNLEEHTGSIAHGMTWSNLGFSYDLITFRPIGGITNSPAGVYTIVKTFVRALNRLSHGGVFLIDLSNCRFLVPLIQEYLDEFHPNDFQVTDIYEQRGADRMTTLQIGIKRTSQSQMPLSPDLLQEVVRQSSRNLYLLNWVYSNTELSNGITDFGWQCITRQPIDKDGVQLFSKYKPTIGAQRSVSSSFNMVTGLVADPVLNLELLLSHELS